MADPQQTPPIATEGNSEQSVEARVAALEKYMTSVQPSAPAAASSIDFRGGTMIEVPLLGSVYVSPEIESGTRKAVVGLLILGVLDVLARRFLRARRAAK